MWTFWYHIPDENEAFMHTNFEKIITCDTVDEVECVIQRYQCPNKRKYFPFFHTKYSKKECRT